MSLTIPLYQFDQNDTESLVNWAESEMKTAVSPFAAAQNLVTRLGGHFHNGRSTFGFWVPELADMDIPADRVFLELLRPQQPIDLQADKQTLRFWRTRLPVFLSGEFAWGVYTGVNAGNREQIGDFYWLVYADENGRYHSIRDPLAHSVPFGVLAPAELYDLEQMTAARADKAYFSRLDTQPDPDGTPRVQPPVNILQIHVNTACASGTLAGLTDIYQTIAAKIESSQSLSTNEQAYIGYDAVQLMPIEPLIEHEAGPLFWEPGNVEANATELTIHLRQPNLTNWGYDVMTVASPAPNPCVLASKRPDELVDFIATLHNFPGKPIKVIFDIVYGHTDNQTLPLLNKHYFAGANMYGQNLNYTHPIVRALLLEMQRRKSNFGIDGIRVDGAQDFKYWDPEANEMIHDDDYLSLMNDLEQEVAGNSYRPWMIFEDGRPWPRVDWELVSTYREVTRQYPNVVQWGPLTFAHNTPFLFTFWASKWWRIREIFEVGSHWITGCANHDTLRRGTQVSPEARINAYLGQSMIEIFQNGYDNPAAKLFDYVLAPGIPMDFVNAAMRGPWSFVRNTDDAYAVKVVSEEVNFLTWAVDESRFEADFAFPRLKALGFTELSLLRYFMHTLDHVVQITDYDMEAMVPLLQAAQPPLTGGPFSVGSLKQIARAWMDDVHDYCNISHWSGELSTKRAAFNLLVREFRRKRPFLQQNLSPNEYADYLHPTNGAVIFYGWRRAPDNSEQILFVANMEGAPCNLIPTELPIPDLPQDGWRLALATLGLSITAATDSVTFSDSQGVVFVRQVKSS